MANRLRLSTRVGYFLCALLLSTGASLHAQEKTGSVKGIVRNEQGEKMPFVNVLARNSLTNLTSGAQTDSGGVFVFSRLNSRFELLCSLDQGNRRPSVAKVLLGGHVTCRDRE